MSSVKPYFSIDNELKSDCRFEKAVI